MLEPSNYTRVPMKMDSSNLVKRGRTYKIGERNVAKFSLRDLLRGDFENDVNVFLFFFNRFPNSKSQRD